MLPGKNPQAGSSRSPIAFVPVPSRFAGQFVSEGPPMFRIALLLIAAASPAAVPIPRAQFIVEMDGQFHKMDADRNGLITRAEVEADQRRVALAAAAQRARNAFTALDADKNGQLSFAEFEKLVTAQPVKVNGQPFMAQMDLSKDGQISLIEHRTATLANFDRMDTDKDGVVSPAEMKAAGLGK